MFGSHRGVLVLFACVFSAGSLGGCKSPAAEERWSRHLEGGVWGGAIEQQVRRQDRLLPEAVLLASVPLAFAFDDDVRDFAQDHSLSDAGETTAAALQVVLPAIPVTIGLLEWNRGDQGRNLEVTVESLGSVVIVQQILANTISRDRPDHDEKTSFPSGHTSWAFAATTLIVRNLHDPSDTSFHAVDALIYIPALYGAWTRLVLDKHWASDVAAGAFLGVFLTNWIWDAHYRGEKETRPTVFADDSPRGLAWRPTVDVIDGGLALGIHVSF